MTQYYTQLQTVIYHGRDLANCSPQGAGRRAETHARHCVNSLEVCSSMFTHRRVTLRILVFPSANSSQFIAVQYVSNFEDCIVTAVLECSIYCPEEYLTTSKVLAASRRIAHLDQSHCDCSNGVWFVPCHMAFV